MKIKLKEFLKYIKDLNTFDEILNIVDVYFDQNYKFDKTEKFSQNLKKYIMILSVIFLILKYGKVKIFKIIFPFHKF